MLLSHLYPTISTYRSSLTGGNKEYYFLIIDLLLYYLQPFYDISYKYNEYANDESLLSSL